MSLPYLYKDRDHTSLNNKQLLKNDIIIAFTHCDFLESLHLMIKNQEDVFDVNVLLTLQNSRH